MKKYASVTVEVIRECAECENNCEYLGAVYGKPGSMDVWECKTHGKFYEMTSPLADRGYLYTGMYNPRGRR